MENLIDPVIITSAVLRLVYAIAAVYGAVLMSRWLDIRAGIVFRDILPSIKAAPVAAAQYFGMRFLAICLLMGWVMG